MAETSDLRSDSYAHLSVQTTIPEHSESTQMTNFQNPFSASNRSKCSVEILEKLASLISGQLFYYMKARIDLIDIYELIASAASGKFCIFDNLIRKIERVILNYQNHFHHYHLQPIKLGFTFECEVLLNLLRAQIDIQHWRFLPSLLSIQEAQTKLTTWRSRLSRETPRRGVKSSFIRPPITPPLYQWLSKLKVALNSKFTLYFYSVLVKQAKSSAGKFQ